MEKSKFVRAAAAVVLMSASAVVFAVPAAKSSGPQMKSPTGAGMATDAAIAAGIGLLGLLSGRRKKDKNQD